jgi:hypothetical protein
MALNRDPQPEELKRDPEDSNPIRNPGRLHGSETQRDQLNGLPEPLAEAPMPK